MKPLRSLIPKAALKLFYLSGLSSFIDGYLTWLGSTLKISCWKVVPDVPARFLSMSFVRFGLSGDFTRFFPLCFFCTITSPFNIPSRVLIEELWKLTNYSTPPCLGESPVSILLTGLDS